jgi:TPR repeat protein
MLFSRSLGIGLFTLALAMGAALAAPEDDFGSGQSAYRSGDIIGALALLRRAADQGHAPAQALLAEILDRAEFNAEALAWYRKAAEQGNAAGEFGLGTMYLSGEGVTPDRSQALFWFRRAAEHEHPGAIVALAQALMNPSAGDPSDNDAVLRWVRRAAEMGYVPAVERLAAAYGRGELGLAADEGEAKRWRERALELKKRGTPQKKRRS